MIKYKLLDNGTGVILSRQAEIVEGELELVFEGAPEKSIAVFELDNGTVYYRTLTGGRCGISVKLLSGEIKVTIAVDDGSARPRKWICEELKAAAQRGGGLLIAPNDMNLPLAVVTLKLENEELRGSIKELHEKYDGLSARLEELMEGYDLT